MQLEIGKIYDGKVKGIAQYGAFVKVKVLSISDDGKIGLSIKKANENDEEQLKPTKRPERKPNVWEPKKKPPVTELGFEEMLTRFKQNSEEKICALKRNTERKNGSRRK